MDRIELLIKAIGALKAAQELCVESDLDIAIEKALGALENAQHQAIEDAASDAAR